MTTATSNLVIPGRLTNEDLPGVEIYLMKVDAELAKEMLANNSAGQRSISKITAERYAADMETGDWLFNGAPIMISNKGKLLDGQHRLTAIADSGQPQTLLIVAGVDASAMATIDAGRKRSYADLLRIRQVSNPSVVAALTARVWHWYHGNYGVPNVARVGNPLHLGSAPSHAQRDYWMERIEKEYEITFAHAAKFANYAYSKRRGISNGTYALAWVLLSGVGENKGQAKSLRDSFFHELLEGSDDTRTGNPTVALHNRLNLIKPREDFDSVDQLHCLMLAYNGWVKGTKIDTIKPLRPRRWNALAVPLDYNEIAFGA